MTTDEPIAPHDIRTLPATVCEFRSRVVAVVEGRYGYGHDDGTRAGREIWSPRAVRGGSC